MFHESFLVQCVGIKINDEEPYLIWGKEQGTDYKSGFGETVDPIKEHLTELMLKYDDEICIYAHNMAFDGPILKWKYGINPDLWVCTARMSSLLWPHESAALAKVAPRCKAGKKGRELVLFKDQRIIPEKQRPEMARYCKNDIELTYRCLTHMANFIPNDEIRLMDITLRMFIDRPFKVDKPQLTKFIRDEEHERQNKIMAAQEIDPHLTRDVLASSDKFAGWIVNQGIDFEKVLSPTTKNPNNMKWPLAKDSDQFRDLQLDYPNYRPVWEARLAVASNINITRAERMLRHSTKHHYNHYEALGFLLQSYGASNTLRWSGSNKINGQNLPKGTALRTALYAPEGDVVCVHDQSNIEVRMLAWLAQETKLLEAFAEKRDIYSEFATSVYSRPISKETPVERFVGKTCILGLGYQMGARRLRNTLGIGMGGMSVIVDHSEAHKLVLMYRSTYTAIVRLWAEAAGILQTMISMPSGEVHEWRGLKIRRHSIELPNGTFLQYPNIRNHTDASTGETEVVYNGAKGVVRMFPGKLVENIIQALSRIVIAQNVLDAVDVAKDMDGQLALLVHDEIVSIIPEPNAERYMQIQSENMRRVPAWCEGGGLVLDVEGGYAANYSK